MLDCAGLDVLVEAHNQFLAAGGALIMTGVGGRIARLLEITALDRTLFTVARTSDGEAASSITMSSGRSEHARSSHDRTS